jgi:hypothetical protein
MILFKFCCGDMVSSRTVHLDGVKLTMSCHRTLVRYNLLCSLQLSTLGMGCQSWQYWRQLILILYHLNVRKHKKEFYEFSEDIYNLYFSFDKTVL